MTFNHTVARCGKNVSPFIANLKYLVENKNKGLEWVSREFMSVEYDILKSVL